MSGTVHIIGAGLAGLSAAVHLTRAGARVEVHEAARFAGGRCRSYFEPSLGLRIDNGNHLVLSGNRAAFEYLGVIGASDKLVGSAHADFPFVDVRDGARWTLRINDGRLPWWIFSAGRRVPGTKAADYLALGKLLRAKRGETITGVIGTGGALYEKLWRPVLLSALNTEPEEASAELAGAVVRESLAKGGLACRPMIAAEGLATAFVDPALAWLEGKGVKVRFDHRLQRLVKGNAGEAAALEFAEGDTVVLGPQDRVVIAVPAVVASMLLPGIAAPDAFRAILNVHFKIAPPRDCQKIIGVVGGITEWLFAFEDRLSVTVSAADRFMEGNREALARDIWREVAGIARLDHDTLPPWQIIKERRATFAALPSQDSRRARVDGSGFSNVALAGDWTDTGLPATIEGAIRSGEKAANWANSRAASAATGGR